MRLGLVLRKWRYAHEMPLRDLAKQMGTSAATLMRIEQGRGCDAATLMKVFNWLMEPEVQGRAGGVPV